MTVHYTANFSLGYIDEDTPLRELAAASRTMAEAADAALTAGGVAPPSASDLVTVAGRVTALETPPGKRVRKASAQTLSGSSSVWVLQLWDTEDVPADPAGVGMYPTSPASPNKLIATKAGRYRVTAGGAFAAATAGDRRLQIRKNSGGSSSGGTMLAAGYLPGVSLVAPMTVATDEFRMAVSDYVDVWALSVTASSFGTTAGYEAAFSLSYIGK